MAHDDAGRNLGPHGRNQSTATELQRRRECATRCGQLSARTAPDVASGVSRTSCTDVASGFSRTSRTDVASGFSRTSRE